MLLPGDRVPEMLTPPEALIGPVPLRVVPALVVKEVEVKLLLTTRVPAVTAAVPTELIPVKVNAPPPCFVKVPVPLIAPLNVPVRFD